MMTAMLAEAHAAVTPEQAAQIESLARDVGLDEPVSRHVRAMAAHRRDHECREGYP
jgi:hypothetical protein